MIKRLSTTHLIRPEDVTPLQKDWDVIGAFNPGVADYNGEVVLVVRVAERPREKREGFTALPRWDRLKGYVVDWVANEAIEFIDPRIVRLKETGAMRLTFISHLQMAACGLGEELVTLGGPVFLPDNEYEEYGVEDPRITKIADTWYMTYVCVSRHGAATALASTKDFFTFKRHGIIFPPENKDVVLFPECINGNYFALHRPNPATHFTRPEMWVARSPDLIHWGRHKALPVKTADWGIGRIGAGLPPFMANGSWVELYHGNTPGKQPGDVGAYVAGALLLDAEHPHRIQAHSSEPILRPEAGFERAGFVGDVVFPTGYVQRDDELWVYYGAADTSVGLVKLSIQDILWDMVQ